jgi:hypothetical protein
VTESLGFGKISFASPDRFFRNLTFRDIHYRADNIVVASFVHKVMWKIMKMLYRTIRQHQPIS